MKIQKTLLKCLITVFCLFLTIAVFADNKVENIESRIIEPFDNVIDPDDPNPEVKWIVRGSKFLDPESLDYGYVEAWPEALFSKTDDTSQIKSFGITAAFDRVGYNYLEIIPCLEVEGELKPTPLGLPGQVKSIGMWVWGSNYNYYLEVHLLDNRGIKHVLFLGDLSFVGWKNLFVQIPNAIPQTRRHTGTEARLKITKFVIWTRPNESAIGFYIFLDHLKVLTDTFIEKFDGDELADKDYLETIWKSEKEGN